MRLPCECRKTSSLAPWNCEASGFTESASSRKCSNRKGSCSFVITLKNRLNPNSGDVGASTKSWLFVCANTYCSCRYSGPSACGSSTIMRPEFCVRPM